MYLTETATKSLTAKIATILINLLVLLDGHCAYKQLNTHNCSVITLGGVVVSVNQISRIVPANFKGKCRYFFK